MMKPMNQNKIKDIRFNSHKINSTNFHYLLIENCQLSNLIVSVLCLTDVYLDSTLTYLNSISDET